MSVGKAAIVCLDCRQPLSRKSLSQTDNEWVWVHEGGTKSYDHEVIPTWGTIYPGKTTG